jgi:predicted DNA-binding protein with PD1-like motif
MKIILQDNHRHFLRFDKDEEVLDGLMQYAKEKNLQAAYFSAIGTCSTVELGFFNAFLKDYRHKPFLDNMEIVSLTGNIGVADNQITIHAHGSFANNEFSVVGGHVFKAVTLATCEVFIIVLDGTLNRANNPDWNLNLLE